MSISKSTALVVDVVVVVVVVVVAVAVVAVAVVDDIDSRTKSPSAEDCIGTAEEELLLLLLVLLLSNNARNASSSSSSPTPKRLYGIDDDRDNTGFTSNSVSASGNKSSLLFVILEAERIERTLDTYLHKHQK
jgi:hypothetical protein